MVGLKKEHIYQKLREEIKDGTLTAGSKLPREVDLSSSLGISRVTLRPALKRLEEEGYIQRLHGKGTFVLPESSHGASKQSIIVISEQNGGIHQPEHYIVPEVFRFAAARNLHTESFDVRYVTMSTAEDFAKLAKELNAVGIIMVCNNYHGSEPIIDIVKGAGLPVLLPHAGLNDHENTGFSTIYTSNRASWLSALEYLKKQGCFRIAQLGNADNDLPYRYHSANDMGKICKKMNIDPDSELFGTASINDDTSFSNAVSHWLEMPDIPDAILCFSDFFAFHVYKDLKERGITVPQDIGVMGICGAPDAAIINPPLTTIDYCYSELAEQAVALIADGKLPPEGLKIEHKYVLRKRSSLIKKKSVNKQYNIKKRKKELEVSV